mgnify:CR=1
MRAGCCKLIGLSVSRDVTGMSEGFEFFNLEILQFFVSEVMKRRENLDVASRPMDSSTIFS